jgi:sugar phosphate permease
MSIVRRWVIMSVLSMSGGIIFLMPFLQEIYTIPLATALQLSYTQVGSLMSAFGVTAMICYFPGGWLADRVSPRKLISLSLITTGAAGLYFSTFPSYKISLVIHALWGVTITLLFWGAMIRVTRNWAPAEQQGRAFGILESGRGISEVLTMLALVKLFDYLGSGDSALSMVLVQCASLTILLGVIAWFSLEDSVDRDGNEAEKRSVGLSQILGVLRLPAVWLISIVIFTGYCAYWGTFSFTPYASEVLGLSVTIGATIGAAKNFFKPAAALVAGFVSDRLGISRSVSLLFLTLIAGFGVFAMLPGRTELIPVMVVVGVVILLATFAMRGIYFALLEEGGIPLAVTGTATGVVSTIGFTPDIFMPLLGGYLRDSYPGAEGYQYFFLTTAAICGVGLAASLLIYFRLAKTS